jgi:SAM-dependent methyltransferase
MRVTEQRKRPSKKTWNEGASEYDSLVSRTNYRPLKDFMDMEQELLRKQIRLIARGGAPVVVVEIGSGTGRSLFELASNTDISDSVEYFIGIDNAERMNTVANLHLRSRNGSPHRSERKFVFLTMDAENMNRFFSMGQVNKAPLQRKYPRQTSVRDLNTSQFDASRKVFCCLLNTIGVMAPEVRQAVVRAMAAAGSAGDIVALSVFDASDFRRDAFALYSTLTPLVMDFEEANIDVGNNDFETPIYFSHWFTDEEAVELLRSAGLVAVKAHPIGVRELPGHFCVGQVPPSKRRGGR